MEVQELSLQEARAVRNFCHKLDHLLSGWTAALGCLGYVCAALSIFDALLGYLAIFFCGAFVACWTLNYFLNRYMTTVEGRFNQLFATRGAS